MNSSRPQELGVFSNWRSAPHSIMPFAGLEPESHKQLLDFDATCGMDQVSFINPATNLLGVSNAAATVDTFYPSSFPVHHEYYHLNGFVKKEDHGCFGFYERNFYDSNMGLNLGHRTYFSSETSVIDRLFNRSRGFYHTNQVPRCQAEGCKADLSNAKHYHRRHKVCEFHSKATKVIAGGVEQRFCQQCSRFHVLSEFDEVKRSCRKRLADHNRRRRKSHSSGKSPANYTNAGDQKGSSSPLPLLTEKGEAQEAVRKEDAIEWQPKQEPGLSLGCFVNVDDRNCFSPYSTSPSGTRDSSAGKVSISSATAAACLVVNSSYRDRSQQQPTELHNLLHPGQAMFEVGEML